VKLVLRCGGNCGTAVLRKAGAAVLRWRSLIAGVWLNIRAASRAAPVLAFNCGRRFCDRLRTSKQTAAMASMISSCGFWSGQCFRGFRARTWREIAHGRRRSWAFGERRAACGRGLKPAAWPELVGGDRRLAAGWIRGGRSWRSAGAGHEAGGIGRAALGGFPGTGARGRPKIDVGPGPGRLQLAAAGALSGRIWRSCFQKGLLLRSFTELARWAAIYPGGMAGDFGESWWAGRPLRNMRQNGDPDDFCGLGGSLRCRSWDGARGGNRDRSPKASRAWPGWVFCRETFGSSRSGEPNRAENSAGAGLFGLRAHSRHI